MELVKSITPVASSKRASYEIRTWKVHCQMIPFWPLLCRSRFRAARHFAVERVGGTADQVHYCACAPPHQACHCQEGHCGNTVDDTTCAARLIRSQALGSGSQPKPQSKAPRVVPYQSNGKREGHRATTNQFRVAQCFRTGSAVARMVGHPVELRLARVPGELVR